MRRTWLAAVAAVGLVSLGGCISMTNTTETPSLDNTAWVLSSLSDRVPVSVQPTARFEGGRVLGTDGCNRYSAPYSALGNTLEVGPRAATTQMACTPELMKQAESFVAALMGAKNYRVRDRQLQLHLVVGPEQPIARAISLTGLDAVIPVHPTREAALAHAG